MTFWSYRKNGLIGKKKVNFKIHDVTAWLKLTIAIHIFPSISRSKDNQTLKFGQLTECNMRNIFREKRYTNCGGETIPRPFSKKSKLKISLD